MPSGMFTLGDAVSIVAKTSVTTETVSETAKDTFQKIQAGTAFVNSLSLRKRPSLLG